MNLDDRAPRPGLRGCLIAVAALLCWSSVFAPVVAADAPDFVRMMREEGRAVVNISTTRVIRAFAVDDAMPEDTSRDAQRFDDGESDDLELHSLGSGFIISADGYLVTNAHVASGPDGQEILVRLFLAGRRKPHPRNDP